MSIINTRLKRFVLLFLALILVFSLAGCKKTTLEEKQLKEVEERLFLGDVSNITADINLPRRAGKDNIFAAVTWVSNNEEVIKVVEGEQANFFTGQVTRPVAGEADVVVELTATLKIKDKTLDKIFKVTVKAMPAATKATVAEAKMAVKGEMLEITGVVIATITNGYTVKDDTGAMYVYHSGHTLLVGDKVKVTGAKDIYYDMPQLGSPSFEKLGTEEIKFADIAVEKDLAAINAVLPTAKEQYGAIYKVAGTVVDNGSKSTYGLEDPLTGAVLAIYNSSKGLDELKDKKTAGKYVEMFVVVYDRHSGGYWRVLYVPGSVTDATAPQVTDEVKVENAITKLTADFNNKDVFGEVLLPLADSRYEGLTLAWVSNKPTVLSNDGKVGDITEDTEVTFTVTVKLGDVTETVEIKMTAKVATMTTVSEARGTITADDKTHQLWFSGIVIGFDKFGYFVADESTSIYVRDTNKPAIKIGDEVEIKGVGKVFYATGKTSADATQATIQVDGTLAGSGYSVKVLKSDQTTPLPAPTVMTVAEFVAIPKTIAGTFGAKFYGKFVKVTGTLVEAGTFKNLHLKDADGKMVMIYHNSLAEPLNQLAKLLGKEVTLTLLPIDQSFTDGWRLAFLGRDGDVEVELTEAEKLAFVKEEIDLIVKENDNVTEDLAFKTASKNDLLTPNTRLEWTTNNLTAIDATGKVVRPEEDTNVKITVKVFFGDATEPVKTYEVNVVVKSASASFWTTETFDNLDNAGSSYVGGKFTGVNNIEWTYTGSRGDLGDFPINGKGLMIANQLDHSGGPSTLKATITGGIGDFKLDTLKAFTGAGVREIELFINGASKGTFKLDNGLSTVQVFEVKNINIAGEFTLEIKLITPGTARSQITLDNLAWTNYVG